MTTKNAVEVMKAKLVEARRQEAEAAAQAAWLEELLREVGVSDLPAQPQPTIRTENHPKPARRGEITDRIIEFVEAHPGVTLSRIGERLADEFPHLDHARRSIYNTGHSLCRKGRLRKDGAGKVYPVGDRSEQTVLSGLQKR